MPSFWYVIVFLYLRFVFFSAGKMESWRESFWGSFPVFYVRAHREAGGRICRTKFLSGLLCSILAYTTEPHNVWALKLGGGGESSVGCMVERFNKVRIRRIEYVGGIYGHWTTAAERGLIYCISVVIKHTYRCSITKETLCSALSTPS